MDNNYEKKWANEGTSSSAVLINEPMPIQQAPVRIRHYFVFSLFSAICLCPATGLIALAYSVKSSAKADVNFHDKARLYSRRALCWNVISVLLVIFSFIMACVFFHSLNEMMKVYGTNMNQQQRSDDINKIIQSITNNQ